MSKLQLAVLGGLLVLGGCIERKYGPELTEAGEIYDTCYVPPGHGTDTAVGLNTSGNLTVTPINVTIPERYAIVFKCQHGKFVIGGDRGKVLYKKLSKGDRVTIRYCEELEIDGGKTNAVDLHFIDADVVVNVEAAPSVKNNMEAQ